MATYSSTLVWKTLWTEEPGGLRSIVNRGNWWTTVHAVAKSRNLSDPMDCSPPGSSICGIFQARALEWAAIAFSTTQHTQH